MVGFNPLAAAPLTATDGAAYLAANAVTTSNAALGTPALVAYANLTANGITTSGPTFGFVAINKVAFTANNLTTSNVAQGAPILRQVQALSASAIATSNVAFGAPTLSIVRSLTANGLATSAPVLGSSSLSAAFRLTANSLATAAPGFGLPTLTENIVNFTAVALQTSAPAFGQPLLRIPSISNRILLGAFPEGGGKYGLRVSQPGYNVLSNPVDDEQLVFNSDWPAVLPIHQTGTVTLTAGQTQTINFPSLGYTPFVTALVKRGSGNWQQFITSNTLYVRRSNGVTRYLMTYGMYELTYDGNGFYDSVKVNMFTNNLTIYSSAASQVVYIVYHIQAF